MPVLSFHGLKLPSRALYLRAVDIYAGHHVDFEDALAVAHVERRGIAEILSYDGHFDRIAGVRRRGHWRAALEWPDPWACRQ